ncbi:OmpA family protein [Flavobacterium inviolabile]|uniref:OmpA family protein n=1 Tax=Flavobacterium inviolabile TaxID=2748320 RepID=UPI0015A78D8E|nr:OmpA family protein [Flavobacterium inviolabile]
MKKIVLQLGLLLLLSTSVYSQKGKIVSANKEYDNYAYVDAIKTYEKIADKGYKSVEVLQKLGDSYYFNGKLESAAKWYGELFAMSKEVDAEYYYRYSQSLKSIGEYEKANQMLARFNEKNANDVRGKEYKNQTDYLEIIKQNSGRYTIDNAGINTQYSDYGSSFFENKVIFTSARDTSGVFSKRVHTWTGESFTNLYAVTLNEDGSVTNPERFAKEINTRFHEATPVFTKDGKTMYFTRNNYNNGKKGKDSQKTTLLKIYRATLKDGKWTAVTELPFNSNSYSTAHPALSPDDKTLYFASNMPGTLGQSDIFKVAIKEDGSFGTPENLGTTINTPGRETFPFVSADNELYFASDGHLGLGGLDIFVSRLSKEGTFKTVQNIGAPANSPKDDFSFLINTTTKKGFLSSNREGGQGTDDIYKFTENQPLQYACEQLLAGIVTDTDTAAPLRNATVTLFDENFKVVKTVTTDAAGNYNFGTVDCQRKYFVKAELPGYNTRELSVIIPNTSGSTNLPVALDKTVKPVQKGDDLAKTFGIRIIYFDLDKWNIRRDAAVDLAKIVEVMKENPKMRIDVRSHTDSRQTHEYNERLSDRRARSTIAWMVKQGIEASRLTGKGYGETQLLNKCADGISCSEEEHQLNRRSEFIIVDM